MPKYIPLLAATLALSACAYAIDKTHQDVKLLTPGAENALCYMYVDGFKYRVRPPTTISIMKSNEDLVVDCLAPGNRRREVIIEPKVSSTVAFNAGHFGFPGIPWDLASNAAFKYPEVVEVDFTSYPLKPEALPAHDREITAIQEYRQIEEYTPAQPKMNRDRFTEPFELRKRQPRRPVRRSVQAESESATNSAEQTAETSIEESLPSSSIDVESLNPAPQGEGQASDVQGSEGQSQNEMPQALVPDTQE